MISIEHLTKSYGGFKAVEDLCFTLEKGYIYGFLGPNGAGKSTTMNMISGYLAPTDGKVIINDIDMLKNPEKAKKIIEEFEKTKATAAAMLWKKTKEKEEYDYECFSGKKDPRRAPQRRQ